MTIIVTLLFTFLCTSTFAQPKILTWDGNCDELVQFLNSDIDNEKIYAMQQIIVHADQINANIVAYDLYEVYRNHQNDQIRKMALVALYKTNHYFVLKNLKDDFYRERNPEIRNMIAKILEKVPILDELN